jgi:hypothetical protein
MKSLTISALSLMVALAAGLVAIRVHSPRPAEATSNAGISPHELQLQIDPKSLPEQKIDDPV